MKLKRDLTDEEVCLAVDTLYRALVSVLECEHEFPVMACAVGLFVSNMFVALGSQTGAFPKAAIDNFCAGLYHCVSEALAEHKAARAH